MIAARRDLEQAPHSIPSLVIDALELVVAMVDNGGEISDGMQCAAGWMLRRHHGTAPPEPSISGCPEEIAYHVYTASYGSSSLDEVYFIQAGDAGPIKIGHSTSVRSRLISMQSGSPVRLRLLLTLPGGQQLERFLHQAFAQFRKHGEWFEPHPSLVRIIETAKSPRGVASKWPI